MLETIREYAAERLEESGEAPQAQQRHAELSWRSPRRRSRTCSGRDPVEWLARLEREHENLRAAFDRLDAWGETQRVLRLAGALREFWGVKSHFTEGRRRLERALGADIGPTAARAKALNGASDLALVGGDFATARLQAEEGLALNRALGRTWGTADSLLALGNTFAEEGDFERAQQLFDESVNLFRELGDEHNMLEATRFLAWACGRLGDQDRARALLEYNLHRARAVGDQHIAATSLDQLAGYALNEGRVQDALAMLKEAHRLYSELGDVYRIAVILGRLLVCSHSRGGWKRQRESSRARRFCCRTSAQTAAGSRT